MACSNNRQHDQPVYPKEVLAHPSYHPYFTKAMAVDYVKKQYQGEGTFLVRPSSNNDPKTISITTSVSEREVCHARVFIEWKQGNYCYHITEKLKFSSFAQMLAYYKEHRIHCKQNIENIKLLIPLVYNKSQSQILGGFQSFGGQGPSPNANMFHNPGLGLPAKKTGRKLESRKSEMTLLPSRQPEKKVFKIRSKSEGAIEPLIGHKYSNISEVEDDVKMAMKCRPPLPLPISDDNVDMNPYYTYVDANKNFFRETYQYLKELQTQKCECGLRLCDSELPQGWTIHRSNDPATQKRIFFQQGEDTTWEMPAELPRLLTQEQVKFIIYLCRDGKCPIPTSLRKFLDTEMRDQRHSGTQSKVGNHTMSNRSSTSSNDSVTSRSSLKKEVKFTLGSEKTKSQGQLNAKAAKSNDMEAELDEGYEMPRNFRSSTSSGENGNGQSNAQEGSQRDSLQENSSSRNKVPATPELPNGNLRPVSSFSFDSTPSTFISSKTGCPDVPPMVRVDSEKLLRREIDQQNHLTHDTEEGQKEALGFQQQFQQLGLGREHSSKLSMEQMQQVQEKKTVLDSFLNGKPSTRL